MGNARQRALGCVAATASELPAGTIEWFAAELESIPNGQLTQSRLERLIKRCQGFSHRRQLQQLMQCLSESGAELPPAAIAWALRGAGAQDAAKRGGDELGLVWTGPEVAATKPRESFGALIEVIDSSREQLTIASFAAYKVQPVVAALQRAIARGVQVRLILESAKASGGKVSFDPYVALGLSNCDRLAVYTWPQHKPRTNAAGQYRSLHMKCAVADASLVLISSANLTDHALNLNEELGTLVRSADFGGEVSSLLNALIDRDVLELLRE
jgi:phosphatidylserine/phosphatidylglycerophosphate/cardiolipin synthase-like enzyme